MNGVPSQLSWVALWADVRVLSLVVGLCTVGLAILWVAFFGISAAITALGSCVTQVVRAARLR